MRKYWVLPLALTAVLGLAACSPKAQNETAEAADTIAADANATMSEAVNDTNAAADKAFGSAEATMDNSAAAIGNATDSAMDRTGNAMKAAGDEIED
ncbi:MAG: hypothetical protein JWN66_693 [Sphingomonas bacterium]|jgi:hypothetical protein|uniref:hypothetical protein n=1 Tax=Sphingomonas bacterium TaxID=1895847 RepID=UPI00262263DD|nr:hypothetical protein [Sphingomonas bacterium]MDB5703577.1 hypothetical protein [Sphingomonas bacterium]